MVLLWVFTIKVLSGRGFDITKGAKVTEKKIGGGGK